MSFNPYSEPDPPGSPLEKLKISRRSPAPKDLLGYLIREGVDSDLAGKLARAVKQWEHEMDFDNLESLIDLEMWANRHSHPGSGSGDDWDISDPTLGDTLVVSSEDSIPTGMFLSPDGTMFFMVGNGDNVWRYDLSTEWEISTASVGTSFSVASQEGQARELHFSPDGVEMFVVGLDNGEVHRYQLSTPWDITTATFISTKSLSDEDSSSWGIYFSDDGLSMYMVGSATDKIFQYSLSTEWDITTAVLVTSFSFANEDTTTVSAILNSTEDQLLSCGQVTDTVYKYVLSTPRDVSTAILDSIFDVSGDMGSPVSLVIKPDATVLYVMDTSSATVYQYAL